jgi:terminase large subunit-like protein
MNARRIVTLPYKPWLKQAEFHRSPARYRLFGGSAGPGKSLALLMEAFQTALEHSGSKCLLLRRTYPQLESGLLDYFRRYIPREIIQSYNDQKKIATLINGSSVRFGSCQHEDDIWNYQGSEYLFIGFDELTQFTMKPWQTIKPWNRCPIPGTFPTMAGATNPVGVGLTWVKKLWVDRKPAPAMDPAEYNPDDYEFISATYLDNPVYADDPNFIAGLNSMPLALREALKHGRWDVLAGSYFDIFDRSLHVKDSRTLLLQPWWPRWIGIDWGFEHPAAVCWGAQNGDASVIYRELVQRRLSPKALAEAIVNLSHHTDGRREDIETIYLSPDAFAHRTDESSIAEQLGEVFHRENFPLPSPAANDRIGGWMRIYQLLEENRLVIGDRCETLIDTLPLLVRDEKKPEDILKVDNDDVADACRYLIYSREQPTGNPEGWMESRVTSTDPTIRHIQALMAQQKIKGGLTAVRYGRRWSGR